MSASNVIPAVRVIPRIANGCICWYEGDTFSLRLRLELEDQDGAAVTVGASDSVKITFYDRMRTQVQQFVFSGIVGNTVTLDFTEDVSAKFPRGCTDTTFCTRTETKRRLQAGTSYTLSKEAMVSRNLILAKTAFSM